ncbi:MAG TPA: biotin/lipoyl-containing protein [Acidimicrobiia bacterium]
MTDTMLIQGERMYVPERLVVAPSAGVFHGSETGTFAGQGEHVAEGQSIGVIENSGVRTPVCTPFAGELMGMLADPGQRLRAGQPVAWLRVA